ncbi:MAG: hypothetical protein J6T39_02080, partial [Clostridia bacterium]|nr:hypothetical protein [Clostridia bacterium]
YNKIDTRENRVLSYSSTSTYDQIKYYSDKLVVKDSNKHILIISWADGHINTTTVCENVDAKFIGTKENKLFYTVSSVLYVVDLAENAEPLKLCEKTIDTAEGNIAPEIVGNYLYFMHTEDDSTVAYRVNIDAAELQTAEKLVG